jgi:ABC-2 type transport system permease protein
MNIFIREMRAHRKALIIWAFGIVFMVAAGMGKYEMYTANGGKNIKEIFSKLPKSLLTVLGMGNLDVTSASGYFGMLYFYLLLMAVIHAVMFGADVISKEERDKTSEFLFVKPASRNKIITSKLLAALANIVIFNIITLISSIALMAKYNKGKSITGDIVILMAGMFLLQLLFLAVGAGLAALTKNPKSASGAGTGIVLMTYILSIIVGLNTKLDILKYITPFKYFEASDLLKRQGLDPVFVILSILIVVVMISLTYVYYDKRDLNI